MLTQTLQDRQYRQLMGMPILNYIGHEWYCGCDICCDIAINQYSKNDIQIIDNKVREIKLFKNINIKKDLPYTQKIKEIKQLERNINKLDSTKLNFIKAK
ncbi:MAG: hypothetical protein LBT99_03730 [Bifidobacteriaceae bacterium]|jgi:hypothetical protein|nr:hypothetical protein [Bifidobacteriaceae bacterium]